MPQINSAYNYSDDEIRIINSSQLSKSSDWDENHFGSIKDNIKNHLKNEQNLICIYCQLKIPVAHSAAEIEHIAPKGKHPKFMFESKNLALSCRLCNTKKSTNETLVNPTANSYPSDGTAFTIVHPHFDEYYNHIRFVDGIVEPTPNDNGKGYNTIKMCNLDRIELAEERKQSLIIDSHPPIKQKLMRLILNEPDNSDKLQKVLEFIDNA
jgi:uncharacterized protein (TIGR02646 family)